MRVQVDKLGALAAAISVWALALAPFATLKPNRIVQGQAVGLLGSLPGWLGLVTLTALVVSLLVAFIKTSLSPRLAAAVVAVLMLFVSIGQAAMYLTPAGNGFARVSPASGFWLLLFANVLIIVDALAKLNLRPAARVLLLGVTVLAFTAFLWAGGWQQLSIMKELVARSDVFWREARHHLLLAGGSLLAALIIGLPVGLICHRVPTLRNATLSLLNTVQTIPSMALFGLLIAPMGWIALHVPGASEIGIRGIGAAPAFVALVLYSLLPVAANTVSGLAGVPADAVDAARGLGMSRGQVLWRVEIPLATPAILTAIRIVLVQNIGMATIAALIGGGGFGVFVFQGLGQTAMDLVLLGALPTVALALCAAVLMDALVELSSGKVRREAAR